MKQALALLSIFLSSFSWAQDIYDVTKLKIKPSATDYAPVLYKDGFVMSSLRHRDQVIQYTEKGTGKPFADMYYVPWNGQDLGEPVLFDETLATPVHDGPATFSPTGDTICFTRNLIIPKGFKDNLSRQNKLGLFFSVNTNGKWSEPVAYAYNTKDYSIMHPSFSSDGQRIYFASGDPSGHGGSDIYYAELVQDKWSEPINVGAGINTTNNELFPHCAGPNVLYFSSNRPGGIGALDIYYVDRSSGNWEEAVALPEPVNTKFDDLGFSTNQDQMQGLFSSNRGGDDMIYAFRRTTPPFRDCKPQKRNSFCYQFQDIGNFKNPNRLPLEYRWNLGDGTLINSTIAEHCYTEPGKYIVELEIVDKETQHVFFTEASYTLVVQNEFQPVISINDSLRAGKTVELTSAESQLPGVDIATYHWDFGDGNESWGPTHEHVYKDEGQYTLRLDVLGKPNATGHIQNYCVTKKVNVIKRFKDSEDGDQEVVFVNAEEKLAKFDYKELPFDGFEIAFVEGEDVKFTLELTTSKERMDMSDPFFDKVRSKYGIIERYIPEKDVFSYSIGEASSLEEAFEIFKELREWQYLDAEVLAMKMEKLKDLKDLDLDLETVEEYNNTVLTASMVYFDVGKDTYKPVFMKQLDKLVALMKKYPEVHLVISAHTDSDGRASFNQDLSERRAKRVIEYLLIEEVDGHRLTGIGYGEDHPKVPNNSKRNKKLNRRVEFKIVLNKGELAKEEN